MLNMEKGLIECVWSEAFWNEFERGVRQKALLTHRDGPAWKRIVKASRKVMAGYTTSFFIVSRYLPPRKRAMVEIIYAAVRYPDEVVDTFPLSPEQRVERLNAWEAKYKRGLTCDTLIEALQNGVPAFLAALTRVVLEKKIPPGHYLSFLSAMRHDIRPMRRFILWEKSF